MNDPAPPTPPPAPAPEGHPEGHPGKNARPPGPSEAAPSAVGETTAGKKTAPPKTKRRGRKRKWAFRVAATTLLLVGIVAALLLHYTRPKNLKPLLEGVLSRHVGGDVTIGRATLTRGGLLTLDSMWIDVPGLPAERDEFAKLFEVERIAVQLDFSRILRGELRVSDVQIEQPQFHVIEDLDAGQLNIEMLRAPDTKADGKFKLKLPPGIDIKAARVRFAQVEAGKLRTIDAMRLEGELRENPQQKRLYDFELRQYDASARVDATLTGSVDTEGPALHLNLAGFQVDAVHRQFVPQGFRAFWDQLQPTGRLPNLSVTMDSDGDGRLRLAEAVLELDGVAITPPYDELGRPPVEEREDELAYDPRMTEVSGRFVVTPQHVRIENLTGFIEGVRYYASGRWGFGEDAPGTIAVSTDPFTLDEDPKFLASLPMVGLQIFNRIQPSGRFQASTKFTRDGAGGPLEISGVVKLLEANGRYHKFPFPISNLRGVITFDRDKVRLEDLIGDGPNGGTVTIRGEIAPPADGAAVRIAVEARAVPFDEHVMDSFSDKRREGVELFFDAALHRALVEEGVIRSELPGLAGLSPGGAADTAPVFDLGGTVNVDVLIDRAFGPDAKYNVTTTVDAAGANALFRHWPYPLTGQSGKIVVGPDGIKIQDVVLHGPTGGRGVLHGELASDPDDKTKVRPDLRIEDADLPVDKLLVHSIRVEQRKIVEDLHATGRLTGTATVTKPEGAPKTQWQVNAQINGGTVQPHAGGFRIQALAGGFTLGNAGLELDGITGQRGAATLGVDGWFKWGAGGDGFRLDATGRNLLVEPALLDLLPPDEPAREKLAALQAQHQPRGNVNAELRWEKAASPTPEPDAAAETPERRATYTLTVAPKTFGLDYRGDRLDFTDMSGLATIRPDHIDVDRLAASFDTGRAEVDGLVGLDGVTPTALTMTAAANAHCPYTRKFLPANAVAVLDALSVTADYRLTDARLLRRPDPQEGQAQLEFDAKIRLDEASLAIGVPITQLRGALEARVRQHPRERRPRLSFEMQADQLRAADRRIAPLTLSLNNREDAEFLAFDHVLGGVYGGILVGSGRVPLDRSLPYRFDVTLSDVEVDPFLKPAEADPTHGNMSVVLASGDREDAEPEVFGSDAYGGGAQESGGDRTPIPFSNLDRDLSSGLLSASLSIEAPLHDSAQRRGRGALMISDARLYDRPISTALLRASNLALPSGAPLNAASARYLIDGSTVRFDELVFAGPGLTIAGAGTMTLPGTELNLVMVSRSNAPRLGPVSDLIEMFKDEIIAIRVTGTLESPESGVTTLRGLEKGWRSIFGTTRATLTPDDNVVGE